MRFDWDAAKNRTNIRDHGLAFADAEAVFEGPTWERWDDREDYDEDRWVADQTGCGPSDHLRPQGNA